MTVQERLAKMEQKIDDLPGTLTILLDERYYTRREGRVITGLLALGVSVLGVIEFFKGK